MKKQKKAFTLIELLLVVLIIGILAAIAVPQYQKAVERTKAMQAITLLKSMYQAAVFYKESYGTWPNKFADLEVQLPASWTEKEVWDGSGGGLTDSVSDKDWTIELGHQGVSQYVQIGRRTGPYRGVGFFIFYDWGGTPTKEILCMEQGSRFAQFNYIKLGGSTGDYCNKIMHATQVSGKYVIR